MLEQFVTCNLDDIVVGESLPGDIYLYIDFRFITFRAAGDVLDRNAFDRLQFKKISQVFVLEKDRLKFQAWSAERKQEVAQAQSVNAPPEVRELAKVREDVHRKTLDIFQSAHPDKVVTQTLAASKRLVTEVMKVPFAVQSLAQLQTYSKGTADHSVNVSILSVYLAMQMGYSHALILQHVGMGGLLHDIGKPLVKIDDGDSADVIETKMQEHPMLGVNLLESQPKVPKEVKLIIGQHHECFDGSGYPEGMKGSMIYDLARIVAVANVFDELVGDGKGSLVERQKTAIQELEEKHSRKFDPVKLEKCLRILRMGV